MNIDNLQKIVEILKGAEPEKFDMETIFNTSTKKSCIIGIVYKYFHPEYIATDLDAEIEAVTFFNKFTGLYAVSYKRSYIVNADWAEYPRTNTIEHAVYRIEKLIAGYNPENIHLEIVKELNREQRESSKTDKNT